MDNFVESYPQEHVCAAVVLAPDSDLTPEEICRFVEARCQFHQRFTQSFYAHRSQKQKKYS